MHLGWRPNISPNFPASPDDGPESKHTLGSLPVGDKKVLDARPQHLVQHPRAQQGGVDVPMAWRIPLVLCAGISQGPPRIHQGPIKGRFPHGMEGSAHFLRKAESST